MTPLRDLVTFALFIGFTWATPAWGQSLKAPESDFLQPALGAELWMSTDSEKTSVVKLTGRTLWRFGGATDYQGIDVERAWFTPQGQHTREQTRAYLDFAASARRTIKWSAKVGTNGHTILGSGSIRTSDWSKELFVEREIVETPRGVDDGIYYTMLGASADLVSDRQNTLSAMAGIQKFTGKNTRIHLRGTYVRLIEPSFGLSVQLRARYFHSTMPGEFDYYSPRDFAQVIPVVQFRRFDHTGWMYLIAVGYGAQKATGSHWQAARLADFRLESPKSSNRLQAFAAIQYSNSSLFGAAGNYNYVMARVGITTRF